MTMISDLVARTEVGWTSYSGLTLHRSCPQAWSYRHLLKLEVPPADDPAPALRYGTWWHALRAADAIERGRALGSIKHIPREIKCADDGPRVWTRVHLEVECDEAKPQENCMSTEHPDHWEDVPNLVERVFAAAELWEEAMPEHHAEKWKKDLGTASVSYLLRYWDRRYRHHHRDDIPNEHPIGVEVKWTRQLPGSDVVLLGYTDEVYYDAKRSMVVVRDHKTSGRMSPFNAADDMVNSQLHLNAWGLRDKIAEWGVATPTAISFERVKSGLQAKPKLTTKGKLSTTSFNWDIHTYMDFVESDEAKEAGYVLDQAQVDRITSPAFVTQFFQRTLTPINRNVAHAHLQAAVDSNIDAQATIKRWQKRGSATRNFTGSACGHCGFAKLCRAQMIGGADGEYIVEEYGLRVMGARAK